MHDTFLSKDILISLSCPHCRAYGHHKFSNQMKLFVYVEHSLRMNVICHMSYALSHLYWRYIHYFVELVKARTEVRHSCPRGLLFGGFPVSIHGEGRIPCPGRRLQAPRGDQHLRRHTQGRCSDRTDKNPEELTICHIK